MGTSKMKDPKAGVLSVASRREPLNLRSRAPGRCFHRECGEEFGAAKQEFQEASDINYIMRKYRTTGQLDAFVRGEVVFGEDTGYKTYADAYAALERAREVFLKLPPEIRLELGNDPGRYRELSSEEGIRKVISRMGARAQADLAHAMKLVRNQTVPPSPAAPSAPGGEAAPPAAPPGGKPPAKPVG